LARLVARLTFFTSARIAVAGCRLGMHRGPDLIALENLTVSYRQHPALHHISGHFAAGSLTAVIGPNGSGKSTLFKSIMGLEPTSGGTISVSTPPTQIAYLPQLAEVDRNYPISVLDCVQQGFWHKYGAFCGLNESHRSQVQLAIKTVGLEGFEQRPIGSLSSGQFQRVMFARMFVQDAQLILLDEPFNAVDSKTCATLLQIIKKWHQQKRTVIAVLHDDAQVRAHFPDTLLLAREVVAWGRTADVLTAEHLAKALSMAEAWEEQAEMCSIDTAVAA
jgi:zinc/manganese transport system ATP-binding protein